MRKKDDSLRGALLDSARTIADTEGIEAVNMRSIAQRAGVATGTVYNYFSSKEDILLALTEEYWRKTLHEMRTAVTAASFCGQLEEIFFFLKERIDSSGSSLMNSLGEVKKAGQERMDSMQAVLAETLVRRMEQDPSVRDDIWNETFTMEQYSRFIVANMVMLLRTGPYEFHFLIEMVRRTLCRMGDEDGTGDCGNNI